ncbi:MAG: enoyl-CoA hydratase/isomerase family protein [Saccharospirillum sp.]|nr:enoyl-CoA hydratase/isomerase family protein [Saccharospirillum sp.]
MKETIIIERDIPGLARVVLNKPETGNAYDDELICTLVTALDDLAGDPELKMVWLSGKGAHFCTGPDRQWLERRKQVGRAEHYQDAEQLARLLATLYHFPAPVLLTLRGDVNAAAVGIACCCDLVLASEHTSFCITESLFGQVPALSSPYLVKALGERAATYYALTGDSIDAYTATRLGLINRLIPGDELDAYADVLVNSMLARSVDSLRTTKQVLHLAANETYDDDLIETVIDCSTDVRFQVSESRRQSAASNKQ